MVVILDTITEGIRKMPDNYDLWEQHDAEQEEWLRKRPMCDCCGERIQDESYHQINGERITWNHLSWKKKNSCCRIGW